MRNPKGSPSRGFPIGKSIISKSTDVKKPSLYTPWDIYGHVYNNSSFDHCHLKCQFYSPYQGVPSMATMCPTTSIDSLGISTRYHHFKSPVEKPGRNQVCWLNPDFSYFLNLAMLRCKDGYDLAMSDE